MCEDLKNFNNELVYKLTSTVDCLDYVDIRELGELADIIKDINEAVYYCTVTEAMNNEYGSGDTMNYSRYLDKGNGRMYYTNTTRDKREGKSSISRKTYIESKENHLDKSVQLKELEKYINELTSDIMDMISDSTVEEKQLLQHKIATLANKIV